MILRHIVISVLLYCTACQPARVGYTTLEGNAQGTTFRIIYEEKSSRDFSGSVDSLFRVMDSSMSLWDSTSIITKINANDASVRTDSHFLKVYQKAWEVSEITDGYFDCTVGPLVKAWGFSYKKGLPAPDSSQVDSLLQLTGYHKVRVEAGRLLKELPDIAIDFNAIAQGYTVDVIADFLEDREVKNYLIEVGGEVRAEGKNERGEIWRIGIDKPVNSSDLNRQLQAVVTLNGKSLATSGSYRKFVERGGQKFSHAINPKTGFPITHTLLSISVLADDCMTADAYATAFLVMGLEKSIPLAKAKGLELYGILAEPDGSLRVFQSDGFSAKAVE